MLVKSVHRALNLRHHQHTGKLIHHQHTSYRVLFLLMLVPIGMMVLVNHLQASASSYVVNAVVPATVPNGSPEILSPKNGAVISNGQITVSGTCPVSNLATAIAIYDNKKLLGSAACSTDGTFAVPISLSYGTHKLVATLVAVTGEVGGSSDFITITRVAPVLPSSMTGVGYVSPLRIIPKGTYILIPANGDVSWRGSITGGTAPYSVRVNWGDGSADTYKVSGKAQQTFFHHYKTIQTYTVVITAHDSAHDSTTLYSVALSQQLHQGLGLGLDTNIPPSFTLLSLVEKHIWQIYIVTLSSLVFLWYLEQGRHLTWHIIAVADRRNTGRKGAHARRKRPRK